MFDRFAFDLTEFLLKFSLEEDLHFSENPDTCIVCEKQKDGTQKSNKKENRRGVIKERFFSTGFHYSLIALFFRSKRR